MFRAKMYKVPTRYKIVSWHAVAVPVGFGESKNGLE